MQKTLYQSGLNFVHQFLQATIILLIMAGFFLLLHAIVKKADTVFSSPAQKKSFSIDLQYYFFSTLLVTQVCYFIIDFITSRPAVGGEALQSSIQGLPFWLQILLSLYLVDLIFYWQHRLFHSKHFWPFHAVHHSTEDLVWLSNIRANIVDSVFHTAAIFSIPYFIGFPLDVVGISGTISYFSAYFIHADIPWDYGVLRYVFVSPLHHRWHHSREIHDRNFSGIFAFNDLLFGTYYLPAGVTSFPLGLTDSEYPKSFGAQFIKPWRDFYRTIIHEKPITESQSEVNSGSTF